MRGLLEYEERSRYLKREVWFSIAGSIMEVSKGPTVSRVAFGIVWNLNFVIDPRSTDSLLRRQQHPLRPSSLCTLKRLSRICGLQRRIQTQLQTPAEKPRHVTN